MKQIVNTDNIKETTDFYSSVLNSLPSFNGLWIPKNINKLSDNFISNIDKYSLNDIAYEVLTSLVDLTDAYNKKLEEHRIKNIIKKTFNFPIKINTLSEEDRLHILETFHGPTLTFKDFGARFLAEYLKEVLDKDKEYTILVSTSGDTGSAIASAFYGCSNIRVIILYPNKRVSDMQELQITTYYDNIFAIALDNSFDDCQLFVKKAFLNKELKNINLISANSINIARLLPQTLYYFYTYSQLKKKYSYLNDKNKVIFSVPCGNCGNLTGGLIAKKMGLSIEFIAAQNMNSTFINYINTGEFITNKSKKTISNAMDVSNPSNVKRINYLYNNDGNIVEDIRKDIYTSFSDEERTQNGIKEVYSKYNYIIDPHTSVAYNGYKDLILWEYDNDKNGRKNHYVVVSTADPSKFSDTVKDIINKEVYIPSALEIITSKSIEKYIMNNSYDDFVKVLKKLNNKNLSITFIGMPGSGKSFTSNFLSKKYNIKLIELDQNIEDKYKMKLPEIINKYGEKEFKKIEENLILNIDFNNRQIISTGGSVIYCKKGMKHLENENNLIIYLDTEFDILKIRTENFTNRGIIFNGLTPFELYKEREILYKLYCDLKIETSNKEIEFIANMFRFLI